VRIWSLHPKYLDRQGLVALWREALLAQAVLRGETRGYRHHPQLARFQQHSQPLSAIGSYLRAVHDEAASRGYNFDKTKLRLVRSQPVIPVMSGQIRHEWRHLMAKLSVRSKATHRQWSKVRTPELHPLFDKIAGGIEPWERPSAGV
jgi:hypothetical protein